MNGKPVKLKYLFEAELANGEIFQQDPNDKSILDPKRSQFYDLLQRSENNPIVFFSLVSKTTGNMISVNLRTGLFVVNGVKLLLESDKLPTLPDKFNLIFYRQWTQSVNVKYGVKKRNILGLSGQTSFCEYFIGWECEIAGKKYTQKMAIA